MGVGAAMVGSSLVGAIGSSRAASAQTAAAEQAADVQRYIFDQQSEMTEPWRNTGESALNALAYEFGLGAAPGAATTVTTTTQPGQQQAGQVSTPTGNPYSEENRNGLSRWVYERKQQEQAQPATQGQTTTTTTEYAPAYGGYTATPGYEYRLNEGIRALDSSAASGGNLFSGAAGQALTQFGQDYATNDYSRHLAGLSQLAGYGVTGTNQQIGAGNTYASGMSNAYANMGNAQAAGIMGTTNSIQNGIGNWLGWQAFQGGLS